MSRASCCLWCSVLLGAAGTEQTWASVPRLSVSLWGKEGLGIIPYLHLSTCTGVSHDPLYLKPALRRTSGPKRLHMWTLNIYSSFPSTGENRTGLLPVALPGVSGPPPLWFCLHRTVLSPSWTTLWEISSVFPLGILHAAEQAWQAQWSYAFPAPLWWQEGCEVTCANSPME